MSVFQKFKYFFIGKIPLIFFDFIENKRGGYFAKRIFESYIEYRIKSKKIEQQSNKNLKPRVYIFANSYGMWQAPINSHLRLSLDIAKCYDDNKIEVKYLLSNHPFLSRYWHNGIIIKSNFLYENIKYKDKLLEYIYLMKGIKNIGVDIIDSLSYMTLNSYINSAIKSVEDININDIIIYQGGRPKSIILQNILSKLDVSKKIFLMGGRQEKITDINSYNIVLGPNNPINIDLNKNNNFKYITYTAYELEPFYYEKENLITLDDDSNKITESIKLSLNNNLLVYVKQKAASSIDSEFLDILDMLFKKRPKLNLLVVGDTKENIMNIFLEKEYKTNIFTLNFSNSLYGLFRLLNNDFNTVFILPKITGNGGTNMIAAMSGMPTVIFQGNDAEKYIPVKYFVETIEEYINQVIKFIDNKEARETYKIDFEKFKKDKKDEAKKLYISFVENGENNNANN